MRNIVELTQNLKKAGFSEKQAQEIIKVPIIMTEDYFANKEDFKGLEYGIFKFEHRFESEIARLENKIESEVARLENKIESEITRLENRIEKMESNLTIKLGMMNAISLGVLATLIKLL